MTSSTLLRGGMLAGSDGVHRRDILLCDGVIQEISKEIRVGKDVQSISLDGCVIFPGLIDCHVHCREPGFTHKATLMSEMAAAHHGGIATICDMPNTSPATTSITAFEDKVRRIQCIHNGDIRCFFGITSREHIYQLEQLWSNPQYAKLKEYCSGVKVYFDHSTGNQGVDMHVLPEVFSLCAKYKIPLIGHCEDSEINKESNAKICDPSIKSHSLRRPAASEIASIQYAIQLTKDTGAAFHIAHLSTQGGLALVQAAKKNNLPITCEVAPHHLFFTVDDYEDLGTLVKMNPPLRTREDQDALWGGILDGTIDCIATDHAPHTLREKECSDPLQAPSGVPGLATSLPLLLSIATGKWPHPRSLRTTIPKLTLSDIYRLCFERPNAIFNLRRVPIRVGNRTPISIFNLQTTTRVSAASLPSICGWTPFEGWELLSNIRMVF